ncbi:MULTISPECIES: hypothetical protein [unclassified Sedimentibacter]|uniref:hypothetical protein n=1 Tax=unclassified Sedimentibacter TaxID=2649220 RepID=UPI0027E16A08|nr:hypothetical protein [Sedimentibacter sp. MB35-C1]WMJ75955.1 hypothetical protein RBQ61_09960 [Sedimentibacter sp. MB35-C1]
MGKVFWKSGFLICLLFCLVSCQTNTNKGSIDPATYTWPVTDSLSTEIEYREGGKIKYVHAQTGYADASGIYEDVNYWTVYIENVELGDIENYIAQLKSYGFSYFSFDESEEEPNVEFVWPGYFMWDGTTEKYIIKIYLNEEKQEMKNAETNETFYYNLRLELLDNNIWKPH